jgi:ATP-dependent protease Clp ATPase subunit
MYEIPSRADVRKVVVTAEAIEGKANPLLLSKNEQLVLEGDEASSA